VGTFVLSVDGHLATSAVQVIQLLDSATSTTRLCFRDRVSSTTIDKDQGTLGFTLADTAAGVGVSVLEVSSNGPAHAAGIRVGDVLLAINDHLLRSHQQAVELIDDPNTTRLKINKRF